MAWFNYLGLIFVLGILLPNLVFALLGKVEYRNVFNNKTLLVLEQIGRYGSMLLMVFNIPFLSFGFFFEGAFWLYVAVGTALVVLYWLGWAFMWNRCPVVRAYVLSIIPSLLFIVSALLRRDIPLLLFSACFAYSHITISLNNVYKKEKGDLFFRLTFLFFGLASLSLAFGASFHGERLHPELEPAYNVGVMAGIVCLALSAVFVVLGAVVVFILFRRKKKNTNP